MKTNRWILGSALWVAMSLASAADVKLEANYKSGDSISGEVTVTVLVRSDSLVSNVEFYVGDDLRQSDDSTPYELRIDTIAEPEGPLKLKIAAFTTDGKRNELNLNLVVNNELGKGIAHHIELGQTAMTNGRFVEAIQHGRVALKIDSANTKAKMLLARANFSQGVFDVAQKFVEDVLAAEPGNTEALDLQSAISLERAFTASGADRNATAAAIRSALLQAAQSRAKVYSAQINAFGSVTDENRNKWADLNLRAGRSQAVADALKPVFENDPKQTAVANRYIIALMRSGRTVETGRALSTYLRRGRPDAVGHILNAIHLEFLGKSQESLEAEKAALSNDSEDLTVRSGQVFLALQRNKIPAFSSLLSDLNLTESARTEVLLYRSLDADMKGDFDNARRRFEESVLNEPTSTNAYVSRANQLIRFSLSKNIDKTESEFQQKVAKALFEAALAAEPNSFEALTGLAVLTLLQGNQESGLTLAEAAVAASPDYAPANYLVAVAYGAQATAMANAAEGANRQAAAARANGQSAEAAKFAKASSDFQAKARSYSDARLRAFKRAGELDPGTLGGIGTGSAFDVWRYYASKGRIPALIPLQY